jgi:SAM-dependent methyltransferase
LRSCCNRTCKVQSPRTGEPAVAPETERVRRIWEKLAPRYDKDIKFFERVLFAGGREWVCSQAKGTVLDIGVGTGRNLAYYPADVRLTGIDLSAQLVIYAALLVLVVPKAD